MVNIIQTLAIYLIPGLRRKKEAAQKAAERRSASEEADKFYRDLYNVLRKSEPMCICALCKEEEFARDAVLEPQAGWLCSECRIFLKS